MNTEFHYTYRDASNYKAYNTVVLSGELTFEQLRPFLDDGENFIPYDVGLDELQEELPGFPKSDDHVWHELSGHDLTPTNAEPNCHMSAESLLSNFEQVRGNWNLGAAVERLGLDMSGW